VLENFVYADTPERQAIDYVLSDIVKNSTEGQWELVLNSLSSQSNIRQLSLKTLLVYLELLGIIKPIYSYYAEYKFKFKLSEQEIFAQFEGERRDFVNAIFGTSQVARVWASVDFEALNQRFPSERSRAISALNYLDEQGMIELQTKQMTDVYQVLLSDFDRDKLSHDLFERFSKKEQSEIKRIHHLMSFFESETCLSQSLADYFSDHQVPEKCGHCSVCFGQIAQLPQPADQPSLSLLDFESLSHGIREKLGASVTPVLISRFLCGLTTPLFSRLKVRSLPGFSSLENYRFSEVKAWVTSFVG
jgi:ATP-dependent DNA helicase RecQ